MIEKVIQFDHIDEELESTLERFDYEWRISTNTALELIANEDSCKMVIVTFENGFNISALMVCKGDYEDDRFDEDMYPAAFDAATGEDLGW
jgi:hypothetical protein